MAWKAAGDTMEELLPKYAELIEQGQNRSERSMFIPLDDLKRIVDFAREQLDET